MNKISINSVLACMGAGVVVLGAFGAHALKAQLLPDQLANYQTAIYYAYIHIGIALMAGIVATGNPPRQSMAKLSQRLFIIGIACFSGSILLLTTRDLIGLPTALIKILGPTTPIGGLFLISGWLVLAFSFRKTT
jgi:uncharacterized membrane protein YgdD (TMEM256/DUF423 family)